jgi:hypothetical protein
VQGGLLGLFCLLSEAADGDRGDIDHTDEAVA